MIDIQQAETPIHGVTSDHAGAVVLGAHEDGTPAIEVRATYAPNPGGGSSTTTITITDADFADALAHAIMTGADHLRESAPEQADEDEADEDGEE